MKYIPYQILVLGLSIISLNLFSQNQSTPQIDPRINKHYSQEQIDEMLQKDPSKIEKLNYYYQYSFEVFNPQKSDVIKMTNSDVDIYEFENFRRDNEQTTYGISREGHYIVLLSRKELLKQYEKISNTNTTIK